MTDQTKAGELMPKNESLAAMTIVDDFSLIAGGSVTVDELKTWNETKGDFIYPKSPVSIKMAKDGVESNIEEVTRAVAAAKAHLDSVIDSLDVDQIKDYYKSGYHIKLWMNKSRLAQISSVTSASGLYVDQENIIGDMLLDLKKKGKELNEKNFQITEDALRGYLSEQVDLLSESIKPNLASFEELIARRRELSCLTGKGAINAATKRLIDAAIDVEKAPLIKAEEARLAKEAEVAEKDSQLAMFSEILDLTKEKNDLEALRLQVGEKYPLILLHANGRIDAKIRDIEIRAQIKADNAAKEASTATSALAKRSPATVASIKAESDAKAASAAIPASVVDAPATHAGEESKPIEIEIAPDQSKSGAIVSDEANVDKYINSVFNFAKLNQPDASAMTDDYAKGILTWFNDNMENLKTEYDED